MDQNKVHGIDDLDTFDFDNIGSDAIPIVTKEFENWTVGTVGQFIFEIKHYDEPSQFGIDEGRISKLSLRWKSSYDLVARYDRGWDKLPNFDEAWNAVDTLCAHWN